MKRLRSSQTMYGIQRTAIKFCRKFTHISGKPVENHRKNMGNHENAWNIFENLRKSMKVNRNQQAQKRGPLSRQRRENSYGTTGERECQDRRASPRDHAHKVFKSEEELYIYSAN